MMSTSLLRIVALCLGVFICGGNANDPRRIRGGSVANVLHYSHQVSLLVGVYHICGGSIISSKHILTAASCIVLDTGAFQANIKVLSGVFDQINAPNAELHNVSLVIFHENYSPENFWANDIAILELETQMRFSLSCSPVSLSYRRLRRRDYVSTSGWDANINEPSLRRLSMEVYDWDECKNLYRTYGRLKPEQGCAKGKFIGTGVSKGDGGGALIRDHSIIGIVSLSTMGYSDLPAIFTEIFPYLNWIEAIVRSE